MVEQGSHGELLDRRGAYWRLWKRQSGIVVAGDGRTAEIEADRLRDIPLFAEAAPDVLAELATCFVTERYAAGETIVREGDTGDKLFVIARGIVEVIKASPRGPVRLAILEDGDFFGEMALLGDVPRSAGVVARTPSTCLVLGRERLDRMLRASPALRGTIELTARARADDTGRRVTASDPASGES